MIICRGMNVSTLSSSINTIDKEQKEAILAAFPDVVKNMNDKQKEQFAENMLAQANSTKESITKDSPEYAEKVLRDTQEWAKFAATLNTEKTEARKSQDAQVAALKAQLEWKEADLRVLTKNDNNFVGHVMSRPQLYLLNRQRVKLEWFLQKDPVAGMAYIYYGWWMWARHIKRALHKKGFLKEDAKEVSKKFLNYIKQQKEAAVWDPAKMIRVKFLEEVAIKLNNKYVDIYNKTEGPKKIGTPEKYGFSSN